MGEEAFRRARRTEAPQFEWFGDDLDPAVLRRQRLAYRVEMIASLRRHVGEGFVALAGEHSQMASDDKAINPFHLSHAVSHSVAVATDNLGTLELVLRDPGDRVRMPVFGIYPLARAALEASAMGLWMVQPNDPKLRQARVLRIHVQESREEAGLINEFLKPRGVDDEALRKQKAQQRQKRNGRYQRVERVIEVARRSGLDVKLVEKGIPSIRSLLDEVDSVSPVPVASLRAIWQFLSGLAHPSLLRALQASEVELTDTTSPGILHARMTANEDTVLLALDATLKLTSDLLTQVATRVDNPGVAWARNDVGIPPGWRMRQ